MRSPLPYISGTEQIIAKQQAEENNEDGDHTVFDEQHDRHTDSNPKNNKTQNVAQSIIPPFW